MRPNIGEDSISGIIDRTNGVIERFGGHIVRQDRWGLKKLAYLIKKETHGYYVYIEYAGVPEAVDEIERLFRIDDKVLKYLTVKLDEVYDPAKDPAPVEPKEEAGEENVEAEADEDEDDNEDDNEDAEDDSDSDE
jgi:small subunit ribosomal protein S6